MHKADAPRFASFKNEEGVDYLTLQLNGEIHTHLVTELEGLPALKKRLRAVEVENMELLAELAEFRREKAEKKRGRGPKDEEVDD